MNKQNRAVYFSFDEVKQMLDEELLRPDYLYELKYETINKDCFVDFDQESVNFFTYEADPKKLNNVTYACQDFYDKNGRFFCRNGTRLPDVDMNDALFCLIFAPRVKILADKTRNYFSRLICDGDKGDDIYSLEIPLKFVLTHQDIKLIT